MRGTSPRSVLGGTAIASRVVMTTTSTSELAVGTELEGRHHAPRLSMLVDGERYFAAVAESIERAELSVVIVGWELHSRIRLRRDGDELRLDEALVAAADRGVRVSILLWDHSFVLAGEREMLTSWRLDHPRIEVVYAGDHPLGASHHQKMVVVDGTVAFVGGLDLAAERWDVCGHEAERRDPDGNSYGPFHDLAFVVDGAAARAVLDVAVEHWMSATGRDDDSFDVGVSAPWPRSVEPDLENVAVGIARTRAAYDGRPGRASILALYRRAIARARRLIYIENQYLTSPAIRDALAVRLAEVEGPEVIIVSSQDQEGRLEDLPMARLRGHWLARLRDADEYGRLLVGAPLVHDEAVSVHAKAMIVDDELITLGSANLSRRSMSFDTECNLVVEARGRDDVERVIRRYRRALLGEHLGVAPQRLPNDLDQSWVAAIERLDPRGIALARLEPPADLPREPALPWRVADADEPLDVTLPAEALGTQPSAWDRVALRGFKRVAWVAIGVLLLTVDAFAAALSTPVWPHLVYAGAALGLMALVLHRLRRRWERLCPSTSSP